MTRTVAITGVAGYLGSRLAQELVAADEVDNVVGIDVTDPHLDGIEFHAVDVRDPELASSLTGADTLVHLAFVLNPMRDEAEMADINLGGMRNVLDAAAAAGVGRFVYTSSASAYGAHADNPVPLREEDALRANPDFNYAEHKMESERILRDWQADHPDVAVTVLRPAIVFGPHVSNFISRILEAPRLLRISGYAPPLQVVHEDDAVAALVHVVRNELPGVFNVAADDAVDQAELTAITGRKVVEVEPAAATWLARLLWRLGQAEAPAGQVPYLMHPWIVANAKLRATGWVPVHTSSDTLRETVDANRDFVTIGRTRRTRSQWRNLGAASVIGAAVAWLGVAVARRRR